MDKLLLHNQRGARYHFSRIYILDDDNVVTTSIFHTIKSI